MRCIKIKLLGLTVRFLVRDFHISQRIYYISTAIVIWISCDYPANYPAHMSAMINYQMTTLLASQPGAWHIPNTYVILTIALALTHLSTLVITKSLPSTDDLNTNLSWRHWTWCWSHFSPVVIFIPTSISIPISPPRLRGMWILNQQHLRYWHLQASLSPNSLTIGAAAKWQTIAVSYAHNAAMMLCHQMLPISTFDLKSDLSSWGVRSEGQYYTWEIPHHTYGYIPRYIRVHTRRIPGLPNLSIRILQRLYLGDSTPTTDDTTHPVLGTKYHTVLP